MTHKHTCEQHAFLLVMSVCVWLMHAMESHAYTQTYLSRRLLLISHCRRRRLGREHVLQRREQREGDLHT